MRIGTVLAVALFVLLEPVTGVTRAEEVARANDLTLAADGDGGYRLMLKTSGAMARSSCRVREDAGSRRLVLELPRVDSSLKPSYEFPGMGVGPVKVIQLSNAKGNGLRVEVPLLSATLQGWELTGQGIEVLLSRAAPETAPSSEDAYALGPGDRLKLEVFGHDDLKQELEVLADGTVLLPLVGVLPAAGRTVVEVRTELTRRLRDFLVDPQVSLDITDYRSQPVTVVGEVKKPGKYYLTGPTRLVDIIALAEWLTAEAGSNIIITRTERAPGKGALNRQILIKREDLLKGGTEHNPRIQAGDVVTVSPTEHFYIRGEVARPGQYPLEYRTTLMKAVSIAEGLTPYAKKRGIELHRIVDGAPTKTTLDLKAIEDRKAEDIALMPDDVIIVPRRLF